MRLNTSFLLIAGVAIILIGLNSSCKPKDKEQPGADYDRTALLTNVGNNIIIPNYKSFKTATAKLDSAAIDFNSSPDLTKLTNLRGLFKSAYKLWQTCSAFELGPGGQEYLRSNFNIFPTDSVKIKNNISLGTGNYNLATLSNQDSKGFPALDYLLNGSGADNDVILARYTTSADAAKWKDFLGVLTSEIKTKTANVYSEWIASDGNYINTFINSNGTDQGSSVGLLVNQLNFDLEIIKNAEIGIPAGKQSAGVLYPSKVQSYYGKYSAELALIHINAIQDLYLGNSALGTGVGFDDYLVGIDAKYYGSSLNDVIKNQFTITIAKLQELSDPLSGQVQTNSSKVDAAYLELQKLVVLLKTDMASALGVLITYNDNDGD